MSAVLILAKGCLSQTFLNKLCKTYKDPLLIIAPKDQWVQGKQALFYDFDVSSPSKMKALCDGKDLQKAIVFLDDLLECKEAYRILRTLRPALNIVLVDCFKLLINDPLCEVISVDELLSKRALAFLPKSPAYAEFIGAGKGEIMQVRVGLSSLFAHRHISSISQKRFKIVLVYRDEEVLLAKPGLVIRPNDSLLLVGDPGVLKTVYFELNSIKNRFLKPFGSSILSMIDMKVQSEAKIKTQVACALSLHKLFKSEHLYIRVINAKLDELYQYLRGLNSSDISIYFDFLQPKLAFKQELIKELDVGLIIVSNEQFQANKGRLHALNIPVLKTGVLSPDKLKAALILSTDKDEVEALSATAFDINSQLGLELELYYYSPDETPSHKFEYFEHIKSLAKLYDEKIKIHDLKDTNPLAKLGLREDLLHFLPFDKRILGSNLNKLLTTDFNKLYYKMALNYQLFIPQN